MREVAVLGKTASRIVGSTRDAYFAATLAERLSSGSSSREEH